MKMFAQPAATSILQDKPDNAYDDDLNERDFDQTKKTGM